MFSNTVIEIAPAEKWYGKSWAEVWTVLFQDSLLVW